MLFSVSISFFIYFPWGYIWKWFSFICTDDRFWKLRYSSEPEREKKITAYVHRLLSWNKAYTSKWSPPRAETCSERSSLAFQMKERSEGDLQNDWHQNPGWHVFKTEQFSCWMPEIIWCSSLLWDLKRLCEGRLVVCLFTSSFNRPFSTADMWTCDSCY